MDGMLSQEEINALLSGMGLGDDSGEESGQDSNGEAGILENEPKDLLTDSERDCVGELSNISMGSAATTLSSLVNQKVVMSVPDVSYDEWKNLAREYPRPCVFIQIQYKRGLHGSNVLVMREHDIKIIADLMMGGDGTNVSAELGEMQMSAICEAMNQMMGSACTSLATMLNMQIDISPPVAAQIDLNGSLEVCEIAEILADGFVKLSFKMKIGDLVDSEIMQLFPLEFTKELCQRFQDTMAHDMSQEIMTEKEPESQMPVADVEVDDSGATMSQEEIEKLISQMAASGGPGDISDTADELVEQPIDVPASSTAEGVMSQSEIEELLKQMGAGAYQDEEPPIAQETTGQPVQEPVYTPPQVAETPTPPVQQQPVQQQSIQQQPVQQQAVPTQPQATVSQPQTMANQQAVPYYQPVMPQNPEMNPYGMPVNGYGGMTQPPMMGYGGMPYGGLPYGAIPYAQPTQTAPVTPVVQSPPVREVNVQPAQFQAFSDNLSTVTQKENIDLIMDVPLEVTVELGRTSKSIQDILEFAPGTIIELNKIAGEPIDVLVNGKLVAKGEVVVIEESFGIRVTEIVNKLK